MWLSIGISGAMFGVGGGTDGTIVLDHTSRISYWIIDQDTKVLT